MHHLSHRATLISIALFGVLIRIPAVRIGLSPFTFCDEGMWISEARRMIEENTLLTLEFRSGGVTLIPVVLVGKLLASISGSLPTEDGILLIGRVLLVVIGSFFPPILLAKSVKLLGATPRTEKIAALTMATSPSILAMSKFWYPDHHIVLWSTLFIFTGIKTLKSTKHRLRESVYLGITLGLLISTKYTATVFLLTVPIYFINSDKSKQKTCLRAGLATIKYSAATVVFSLLTILTINYSLIFRWSEFWTDFTFNLNNYSEVGGGLRSAIFYIYYFLFAPFSLFGFVFIAFGLIYLLDYSKKFVAATLIPTIILIASLSRTGLTINRNVAVLYPIAAILFSIGISYFGSRIRLSKLSLVLTLIPFIFFGWESVIQLKHEIKGDSRVHAKEWAANNIAVQETVGVNEFCSGVSPASAAGIPTASDPLMENEYTYYMFNSYWFSPLSEHYLSSRNQANYHFYRLRVQDLPLPFRDETAITDLVPRGYEIVKRFSEGGPEIVVLTKSK